MDTTGLEKEWRVLAGFLPPGWEEAARECGAIRRARAVKKPETLLRLILLHAGAGLSLRQATARARIQGLAALSDVALLKRLRSAEPWLRWMTSELLRTSRFAPAARASDKDQRLCVVDATTVLEPGATGTSWRVHYSLRLPTLTCDFFEVTDDKGGETYKRLPIQPGDIVLADRGYCHREGVAYVKNAGGDVVVRLHTTGFPLVDGHTGERFDLLQHLRTLGDLECGEWAVAFLSAGTSFPARLCAIRRSEAAAHRSVERVRIIAKKKCREVLPETLEAAGYVFVLTTIEHARYPTKAVLELYRVRWQVELAFKRMKSLLQSGHVPKYDAISAQAWIQAKLLTVLLIERLQEEARFFSPWGYPIDIPQSLA